jgi:serine/threonine-protein kinase
VPGSILAGRYRIVGLIGRGGMGEVYRADDLKLEQPVALKFLPHGLDADEERLARFYREVRVARQVSHPAVCRVYDVADAEGHLFLSMELVDGENLASLLRRIGRLPTDKALDIARQLCGGLAAAHEKGVLHRDLKPANVMLDGQGKVRITDFGLAGLAQALRAEDVRSGTPSYMSPEQLQGREVTVRSDVYGLGLLLYELFTGRRAFLGRGLAELTRKHRDEQPIEPSALVAGLDPGVERAILACLEKEPRRRPASALVVAAMLAGRDPLDAAIAAGETPSPELVAAAGEREGLRPAVAWGLLALVLAGALLAPSAGQRFRLLERLPVEKPPAVLEDRARELVARLAKGSAPVDDASGLSVDYGYLTRLRETDKSPGRWAGLRSGPPVLQFWYRQSPRPIVPLIPSARVYASKPGLDTSGMAGVTYGMQGRLLRFYAVPAQLEDAAPASPGAPDWAPLFAEAGLAASSFRPVAPRWTPPFHNDARTAWEGEWPARPPVPVRIEAASYRGQPVWFEVIWPWSRPERQEKWSSEGRLKQVVFVSLGCLLLAAAALMARRNTVLGRGDRRGAFRVALALMLVGLVSFALDAHHVGDLQLELGIVTRAGGGVLLQAAFVWLFYLAVEPYARRLRPWTLVSWTRLLGGGAGDPVVGRDVLAGLAWGVIMVGVLFAANALLGVFGLPIPELYSGSLETLRGTGPLLSVVLDTASEATLYGMGVLLLFVLLRLVLRRDALAAAAVAAFVFVPAVLSAPELPWFVAAMGGLWAVSWILLLLRFGMLAAIVGLFANELLQWFPLTSDLTAWTSGPTVLAMALLSALALLSFRNAVGGTGLRRYLAPETSSRP